MKAEAFPIGGSAAADRPRPRILLIAPHFAEYSLRLAAGLGRIADVELGLNRWNVGYEIDGSPSELAPGIPRFSFQTYNLYSLVFAWLSILWRCVRFRPHLIHFQESSNPLTAYLAPFLARFLSVVLTVHDPLPHQGRDTDFARPRWQRQLNARRKASLLFAHGEYCLERLGRLEAGGDGTRRVSIPHGAILAPKTLKRHEAEAGRLLFFGRMEAYKGLDVLLDAVELLAARNAGFTLTLAGAGPELDRLRTRALGLCFVRIRDEWLRPAAVIDELQAASLIVAPYLEATQSGVVAAALANGRPVVASRVGGLPEAVGEDGAGLLVPPNDPLALADVLQTLLADPARLTQMGEAASARARSMLDWDVIAAMHLSAYEEVIGRHKTDLRLRSR